MGWHRQEPFFCIWSVWQRKECRDARHGPSRFGLLYIGGDAAETFEALYPMNFVAPLAVAVIQPGDRTRFEDPEGEFASTVRQNPAGEPMVLLYGGWGECNDYQEPCWPGYGQQLYEYRRNPSWGGCVRIWARTLHEVGAS